MTEENIIPDNKKDKKHKRKILFLAAFFSAVFLIVATYAWLSTALNVKIKFFRMTVASDSGLFISLDGVNFSDSVEISMDSIIMDLKSIYPNHTNQWATGGLWPVSTNGAINANSDKFDVYIGSLIRTKQFNDNGTIKRVLSTTKAVETNASPNNAFIAFDVFLKNATGSPKSDHLYIDKGTGIFYEEDVTEEIKEAMDGIMNSLRIGFVLIGSVAHESSLYDIQNVKCNNRCKSLIFEPYSTDHTENSIETAKNYGIHLIDGAYTPTYAIIDEGEYLEHTNGHFGTGIPLITSHFAVQNTITEKDFNNYIYELPNGITKLRVYVWLEGQDIDSLETYSKGAAIEIAINFMKDLAGYEE